LIWRVSFDPLDGQIWLSVVKGTGPAQRLYESAGFREFGVETKASKYGDKYYDEALMALDVSRPARGT
jgi:RimJ/RimL family protein N-acetyltransferase